MTEELIAPDPEVGELDAVEPDGSVGELQAQPEPEVGERTDSDGETTDLDPNFDNLPADQLSPDEVRIRAYYKQALEEQAMKAREEREALERQGQVGGQSGVAASPEQVQQDLQTLLAFDAARRAQTETPAPAEEKLDPLADNYEQLLEARINARVTAVVGKERTAIEQQLQALQQRELERQWQAFCDKNADAEQLKHRMADKLTRYEGLDFQAAYDLARIDAARAAKGDTVTLPAPLGTPAQVPPQQDSVSGNAPSDKTVSVDVSGLTPYQQILKQAEADPTGELAADLKKIAEKERAAIR